MDSPESRVKKLQFPHAIVAEGVRDFILVLNEWSVAADHGAELRIEMNCEGGNILDALSLDAHISKLRREGHKITIAAYGRAASCAAWLIQSADVRIMDENAWLLVHEIRSSCRGSLTDMRRELARMEQLQEQTIRMLCSRSRLTPKQVEHEIKNGKDWWISAQTALRVGLIDAVEEKPGFSAGLLKKQARALSTSGASVLP